MTFFQINIESLRSIKSAPNATCIARWEDDGGGPNPIALASRSPRLKARRIGWLPPARSPQHRTKQTCFGTNEPSMKDPLE